MLAANALSQTSQTLAQLGGPALAGVTFATLGAGTVLYAITGAITGVLAA